MDNLLNKYSSMVYDNSLIKGIENKEEESAVQHFNKFVDDTIKAGLKNGDLWSGYQVYADTLNSIDDLLKNGCFDTAMKMTEKLKQVYSNGWLNTNVVWYALDNIFNDTPLTVLDIIVYNDSLCIDN